MTLDMRLPRLALQGLTAPQFAILNTVNTDAGLSNADLARTAFVTPQTMQGILVNLERARLITRSPHPRHGRILCSALTDQGCQVLMQARRRVQEVEDVFAEAVGPKAQPDSQKYSRAALIDWQPISCGLASRRRPGPLRQRSHRRQRATPEKVGEGAASA